LEAVADRGAESRDRHRQGARTGGGAGGVRGHPRCGAAARLPVLRRRAWRVPSARRPAGRGRLALREGHHAGAQPDRSGVLRTKAGELLMTWSLEPVGVIRSTIARLEDAPLFYTEGAPDAFVEVLPQYAPALHRMRAGDELIVVTWLHRGRRDVLQVHPRGDDANPLTGVFSTRSPDRPNPIGLHRVRVLAIDGLRLHVDAI